MAIIHINDETFEKAVSGKLSLVDFWAPWCGPCRMFGPIFEAESENHVDVNFYKFEIDDVNRTTPAKYGIRSIPSVLAFKNGELVETRTGLMTDDALVDWISDLSK